MIGRPVSRSVRSPVPRGFVEPLEIGFDVEIAEVSHQILPGHGADQRGDDRCRAADVRQFHDQGEVVYVVDVGRDGMSRDRAEPSASDPHDDLSMLALTEPDLADCDFGGRVGGEWPEDFL